METVIRSTEGGASPERIAYPADESAYLLGISRSRMYELMAAGEIRSVKIGRSRRIPRQALLDYIASLDRDVDAA
jgi:excisionase family DNA binding protein